MPASLPTLSSGSLPISCASRCSMRSSTSRCTRIETYSPAAIENAPGEQPGDPRQQDHAPSLVRARESHDQGCVRDQAVVHPEYRGAEGAALPSPGRLLAVDRAGMREDRLGTAEDAPRRQELGQHPLGPRVLGRQLRSAHGDEHNLGGMERPTDIGSLLLDAQRAIAHDLAEALAERGYDDVRPRHGALFLFVDWRGGTRLSEARPPRRSHEAVDDAGGRRPRGHGVRATRARSGRRASQARAADRARPPVRDRVPQGGAGARDPDATAPRRPRVRGGPERLVEARRRSTRPFAIASERVHARRHRRRDGRRDAIDGPRAPRAEATGKTGVPSASRQKPERPRDRLGRPLDWDAPNELVLEDYDSLSLAENHELAREHVRAGRYFPAHEAWETAWKQARGTEDAEFYKACRRWGRLRAPPTGERPRGEDACAGPLAASGLPRRPPRGRHGRSAREARFRRRCGRARGPGTRRTRAIRPSGRVAAPFADV